MRFVKYGIDIDFIGKKGKALFFSSIIVLISIVSIIYNGGLNYGIDFVGGALIQVKMNSKTDPEEVKQKLSLIELGSYTVQFFGDVDNNEFLIRMNDVPQNNNIGSELINVLSLNEDSGVSIERVEIVGPQIGKNLKEKALIAIFYTLLIISIYISGRFELKWSSSVLLSLTLILFVYFFSFFKFPIVFLIIGMIILTLSLFAILKLVYGLGAILALVHDLTITIGLLSIFNKEFTVSIVAALLTIVGYSLNDTIIVYDRVRENLYKGSFGKKSFTFIVNKSINDTLSRTVLTSFTTLIVVASLFFFGGRVIHDFAFALLIGVIVGTYSSIYVASSVLSFWNIYNN